MRIQNRNLPERLFEGPQTKRIAISQLYSIVDNRGKDIESKRAANERGFVKIRRANSGTSSHALTEEL